MKPEITLWRTPPQELNNHVGEVQLWRFHLDCLEHEINSLKNLLSTDETIRADRLLDLQKKQQFIVARGRLRQILGRYQRTAPDKIKFQYNKYGKPSLPESHCSTLSFNLSHSENLAVLAITKEADIGVDIEKLDPDMVFSQIVDRYFDEAEKLQLAQYSNERQGRGFYRIWTKKEAILKLEGVGFQKTSTKGDHFKIKKTYLKVFPIVPGFICSIAIRQKLLSIQRFNFPGLCANHFYKRRCL
ncbi:MAG: 4'-phosphopantetheinyl transferase superfamily protein [Desulfuromusa sp.]|nr:4'-phosphopantetheinyl transferase superfamily protein [Desulfuromusa sp.]